jgi:hypothetical protein
MHMPYPIPPRNIIRYTVVHPSIQTPSPSHHIAANSPQDLCIHLGYTEPHVRWYTKPSASGSLFLVHFVDPSPRGVEILRRRFALRVLHGAYVVLRGRDDASYAVDGSAQLASETAMCELVGLPNSWENMIWANDSSSLRMRMVLLVTLKWR